MNRKGFVAFENVVWFSFVFFILFNVVSVCKFYWADSNAKNIKSPVATYSKILETIRNDILFAKSFKIYNDGFTLFFGSNDSVSYKMEDSCFVRYSEKNVKRILMTDIERFKFKKSSEYSSLFSIYLYPANKMFIPFFTSFSLRNYETKRNLKSDNKDENNK